jgi:hypothetical protein
MERTSCSENGNRRPPHLTLNEYERYPGLAEELLGKVNWMEMVARDGRNKDRNALPDPSSDFWTRVRVRIVANGVGVYTPAARTAGIERLSIDASTAHRASSNE